MTIENDATYPKSMILSSDDPKVAEFKYNVGDKFLLRKEAMERTDWDFEMRESLDGQHVIVEVISYEIDLDGKIGYSLSFISPPYDWKWWVPPSMLDSDFIYLGKDFEQARFALMIDEYE